jgi:excisionase family DNA binding protein
MAVESGDVKRAALQGVLVRIGDDLCDLFRICGSLVCIPPSGALNDTNCGAEIDRANTGAGMSQNGPLALRISEAARLLSVSRSSLYNMISKREIGVVRLGKSSVRVPRSEIDRLLTKGLAQID